VILPIIFRDSVTRYFLFTKVDQTNTAFLPRSKTNQKTGNWSQFLVADDRNLNKVGTVANHLLHKVPYLREMCNGLTLRRRMDPQRFSTLKYWAILIVVFFGVVEPSQPLVATQQSPSIKILITSVDSSAFPEVMVQALIQDNSNNPVSDYDIEGLELLENQEPVVFQHQSVETQEEAILVFDAGVGASAQGTLAGQRLEQMKEIAKSFTATMTPGDTIGLVLVSSDGVSFPQPLTSDPSILLKAIDQLTPVSSSFSKGIDGIKSALSELSKSSQHEHFVQSIVFLTSGIEANTGDAQNVVSRAKSDGVVIHTILVREDTTPQESPLQKIAAETYGLYTRYINETSLKPIFDWKVGQRTQYQFLFRSVLNVSSIRILDLRDKVKGAGMASDSISYQVDVFPPSVIVDLPAYNTEFVLKADVQASDIKQFTPSSTRIVAHVVWPDDHPRDLKNAAFLVDNILTGPPLENPSPDQIAFDLNLDSYNSLGENTIQLRVLVEDELGIQGSSDPVQVRTIVSKPTVQTTVKLTPSQSPCEEEGGLTYFFCQVRSVVSTPAGWISILSLLIALGALAIVWFYRGHIREASGAAMERVRDSISHRRSLGDSRVGAFLEVLSIDDPLTGKQIPLYIDKVTLVGRSPQEAELVFDMTKERSVVSRLHCEFREEDGAFKIRDLGSTHGTFLNGSRVPESGDGFILSEGDRIELGPMKHGGFLLLFHLVGQLKSVGGNQNRVTKTMD
jgi:FHA domain/von Willebrand factor type A domain